MAYVLIGSSAAKPGLTVSGLKAEPAGPLNSLEELFAVAQAMEEGAARQYALLADRMRQLGKTDLAEVFERVAEEERRHVAAVEKWSVNRTGERPRREAIPWTPPPTFDEADAADIGASGRITPYRALAIAVTNEERAFAFWSYVAANASSAELQAAAETMARAELEHAALFRRERRRAFRAQIADGADFGKIVDLPFEAAEERLASALEQIADRTGVGVAEAIARIVVETRRMAVRASGLGALRLRVETDPMEIAEALTEAYLTEAEGSVSGDRLDCLQQLAERAILRLSALKRAIADASCPSG